MLWMNGTKHYSKSLVNYYVFNKNNVSIINFKIKIEMKLFQMKIKKLLLKKEI